MILATRSPDSRASIFVLRCYAHDNESIDDRDAVTSVSISYREPASECWALPSQTFIEFFSPI